MRDLAMIAVAQGCDTCCLPRGPITRECCRTGARGGHLRPIPRSGYVFILSSRHALRLVVDL